MSKKVNPSPISLQYKQLPEKLEWSIEKNKTKMPTEKGLNAGIENTSALVHQSQLLH